MLALETSFKAVSDKTVDYPTRSVDRSRVHLQDRLEEEGGGGERNGRMAAAELLAMARGAGAAHAEEGLSTKYKSGPLHRKCLAPGFNKSAGQRTLRNVQ
jgi:hypothetical protein